MLLKLGHKLILTVGITTLLIIGVYAVFLIRAQSSVLISEVERHVNQLSETVKNSTRHDMLMNQQDRIREVVATIGKQHSIHNVRILNKAGTIIYSSKSDEVGEMVDKKTESCYACHAADQPIEHLGIEQRTRIYRPDVKSGRILAIINPIYNERSCWNAECHAHSSKQTVLGVLDVAVSLQDEDAQIGRSEMKAIYFAVIAVLAISLIIGGFVRKWVDKPVKELVKGTHNVAAGNLDYVIPNPRNDELGELAKSFNIMTEKLAEMRFQLLQSGKLASIGRLAAGVAHEINNPLTGVLTYSSFLQKRTRDQPEIQKDLDVIVRETKRCREIVKGLLDFSRQSPPKITLVDIHQTIERTLAVAANQLALSHVTLVKEFCADALRVQADENQMQQVFLNLIVNAIDAIGPDGGTLTIGSHLGVKDEQPYLEVTVKDTGCGIPAENLNKIFEPFYSTKDQRGTGLGLSIIWGILDNHHGRITVQSEPGKGTMFTITLPAV
ncbi:MAG: ATP-binding protein [bacterium]